MRHKQGDRVRHPRKPSWGVGLILESGQTDEVRVFFDGAGEKRLSSEYVELEPVSGEAAHSQLLDHLRVEAGDTPKRFRSLAESIQFFLKEFPGGFAGERLHKEERDYKIKARDLARQRLDETELRQLLADGRADEVCDRAMKIVNASNLIHQIEKMKLSDGLKNTEAQVAFATALAELLYGSGSDERRFTHFADVLEAMGAEKWTIATYFPFLLSPDRHMFLKPTVTQQAAEVCGFEISYAADLNFTTYSRVQEFARWLFKALTDEGLAPRDMIDVQSFIWCIAPGKY